MNIFKNWRESASIIIAAKSSFETRRTCDKFNYKLLTMTRSSKSKFMPGTVVFPGGNVSKADSSQGWFTLYESFGIKRRYLENLNVTNEFDVVPDGRLPNYLSLRITAIRETFEESGILICKSFKIKYHDDESKWGSFVGGHEIKKWQDKVNDNPEDFLNLCIHFSIYPDLWALKEWSNWLTPTVFPTRYNTIFYIIVFPEEPPIQIDKNEAEKLEWLSPEQLLRRNRGKELLLPPPQFYETSKLLNFPNIEDLADFAHERSQYGVEKYFPIRVDTNSGTFSLLPGDDMYPKLFNVESYEVPFIPELEDSKIKHRILNKSYYYNEIITENFKPNLGHLLPLNLNYNKL